MAALSHAQWHTTAHGGTWWHTMARGGRQSLLLCPGASHVHSPGLSRPGHHSTAISPPPPPRPHGASAAGGAASGWAQHGPAGTARARWEGSTSDSPVPGKPALDAGLGRRAGGRVGGRGPRDPTVGWGLPRAAWWGAGAAQEGLSPGDARGGPSRGPHGQGGLEGPREALRGTRGC